MNLFIAINTQWRTGPRGPIGLDYSVLFRKLDRMALTPGEYDELEEDIRTMEAAALDHLHKKK